MGYTSCLVHLMILVFVSTEKKLVQGLSLQKTNVTCVGYDCGPGLECFMKETPCKSPPCPKTASCRQSCEMKQCEEGFYCQDGECIDKCIFTKCAAETYCYAGKCLPNPTCNGVKCNPGEECYLEEVQCFKAPCPPIPTCRPIPVDKCDVVHCKDGFYCDNGECKPNPTCNGVDCGPGKECYLEQLQCVRAPCPPIPTCRLLDRCACDGVDCGPDKECYLEDVQCDKAPCPPPVPKCQPHLTCETVDCLPGFFCQDGKCFPQNQPTCENFECKPGEQCYLHQVNCTQAPCPLIPQCRPILTCATVNCIRGTVCVNLKCIPEPTCDGFPCQPDHECYLKREECTTPPCPLPVPTCRPISGTDTKP